MEQGSFEKGAFNFNQNEESVETPEEIRAMIDKLVYDSTEKKQGLQNLYDSVEELHATKLEGAEVK